MPSRSDPASCHRVSSSSRRTGRGAQRSGIMPSRGLQLPTHRSRSLAIRHHAITRSVSGAKVAELDGPASCLRASTFAPSQGNDRAVQPSRACAVFLPFALDKIEEPGSLAFVPSHLLRTHFMHAQVVTLTPFSPLSLHQSTRGRHGAFALRRP